MNLESLVGAVENKIPLCARNSLTGPTFIMAYIRGLPQIVSVRNGPQIVA